MRVYGGEEVDLCGFKVFAENPSESESERKRARECERERTKMREGERRGC